MSFDKIEFVKPNDILQGGFNPNLPAEITVTEQLLYSIANNLAILNNNLINSGALQNLALLGDLLQEVFTDGRIANKKTSVFTTSDQSTYDKNQSVFISDMSSATYGNLYKMGLASMYRFTSENNLRAFNLKNMSAVVNQATSTYSFNVPVPSVSVSSSPATVNVSSSAPIVTNNIPVPEVTNVVNVASAVPDITVNATAPVVNNNVPVPSVTNEVSVQSVTPTIEVSATAPIVNVSSSPATVNVSATAPVVNNKIDVPAQSVTVQSAVAPVNVSATAPVVNVSSSPANIDIEPYDDSALIAKFEEVRELLEDALLTEVDTDIKKGLADIVLEKDNVQFIDYPADVLTEPSTTKKL